MKHWCTMLEYGILGFLSMKDLSGYEIKKLFDMSARFFWPADQAQIYRTLKKLVTAGWVTLKEQKKGETVDKKVYAITEKGKQAYQQNLFQNNIGDFISRDTFLVQLFFSGSLSAEAQLAFLNTQLENNNRLIQLLEDNYKENYDKFLSATGLSPEDKRLQSAVFTHRWGLIRCKVYSRLLEEIKANYI